MYCELYKHGPFFVTFIFSNLPTLQSPSMEILAENHQKLEDSVKTLKILAGNFFHRMNSYTRGKKWLLSAFAADKTLW